MRADAYFTIKPEIESVLNQLIGQILNFKYVIAQVFDIQRVQNSEFKMLS